MHRLFARLGLGRPELRAWALYDWANSAYITVVITAVFPVYFQKTLATGMEASTATAHFATGTALALAAVALTAPLLGTLADRYPIKKSLLAAFVLLGTTATLLLSAPGPGDWLAGLTLFALGNLGAYGSFVFYDALLPHVARPDELDRVSTAGYALGYLGGGLILAGGLAVITFPQPFGLADGNAAARAVFVAVALWWLLFTIPLLRRVPEPAIAPRAATTANALRTGLTDLADTVRILRRYPQAGLFLLAFLVYNDGIVTVIRMATVYGAEIGLPSNAMIGAIVLVQFVGIPCAFLFGAVAGRIGTRPALFMGLAVYLCITVLGNRMQTAAHFYMLAALVGLVQGGTQALSRSLFASLIPASHSAACFSLFAVAEKAASVAGPLVFAAATAALGTGRAGLLAVGGFFVLGALLLFTVDVEKGRAQARADA
ncbi:MAG: MFS transporter [Nitrospirota bacterium]|nr:MFS transporter [Nitrospirota bacterium]